MAGLRYILRYARGYRAPLILTALSMVAIVGLDLLGPLIIRRLLAAVQSGYSRSVALALIGRLALVYLLVQALRGALQFVNSYMGHIAGWGVVADSRRELYDHVQRLSLRFYENRQTGELLSRVVNDTNLFEAIIAHALPSTAVNVLTLLGVSLVLTLLNWQLMALTLVPIPLVLLSMRLFSRYVRPAFRHRQKELAELNAAINDNLAGIREIKAFTREELEAARISRGIERYRNSLLRALRLMATFNPLVEFSSSLGYVIVIYFGGLLAFGQKLPVSDLVAFFLYIGMFYQPVRQLSGSWEQLQEGLAGAERVLELLKEQPELPEQPGAINFPGRARGEIIFHDVSFAYNEGEAVLEGINLHIPPGAVVALVGPTGVGKTTLASLIPRFYDVTSGCITLDGFDLRALTLRSLRQQVSIVLQDVFLFHGSVRENILFGRPNATEAELIEAAKIANAHDFIMALPNGYDTIIGERGVKLSGGQKQRLAIARAVLKDAPILILDEATSSVDTETELLIQEALERLMRGRTTIIIAHRLSTVRHADMIVVLSGKRIVELGTHEELMRHGGLYRRLWEIQVLAQAESLGAAGGAG
jgi:ABC-type multidrug transport system fused ATPase/permease subunit